MGIGEMMIDRCQHCGGTDCLSTDLSMSIHDCDAITFMNGNCNDFIPLRCLACNPFDYELVEPDDFIKSRFDILDL